MPVFLFKSMLLSLSISISTPRIIIHTHHKHAIETLPSSLAAKDLKPPILLLPLRIPQIVKRPKLPYRTHRITLVDKPAIIILREEYSYILLQTVAVTVAYCGHGTRHGHHS